jgi:hypothetical protein
MPVFGKSGATANSPPGRQSDDIVVMVLREFQAGPDLTKARRDATRSAIAVTPGPSAGWRGIGGWAPTRYNF